MDTLLNNTNKPTVDLTITDGHTVFNCEGSKVSKHYIPPKIRDDYAITNLSEFLQYLEDEDLVKDYEKTNLERPVNITITTNALNTSSSNFDYDLSFGRLLLNSSYYAVLVSLYEEGYNLGWVHLTMELIETDTEKVVYKHNDFLTFEKHYDDSFYVFTLRFIRILEEKGYTLDNIKNYHFVLRFNPKEQNEDFVQS